MPDVVVSDLVRGGGPDIDDNENDYDIEGDEDGAGDVGEEGEEDHGV